MRSRRWTDELQIFVVIGLIGLGLFAELDRLTPLYATFVLVLLVLLERAKVTEPATAKVQGKLGRTRKGEIASPPASEDARPQWNLQAGWIALSVLTPTLLVWISRLGHEFPFSGDHDHHVFAATAAAGFWSTLFWLPLGWGTAVIWFWRKNQIPRYFGVLSVVGLLILSSMFQVPQFYFARYPAFGYLLTAPFVGIANWLQFPDLVWANQITQMLSLPVWLLLLRPWLLRRAPDLAALLVGVFLFWQKDILHYQTSAYLEPWSLVFILLGVEMSLAQEQPRHRALLMIGIASLFKETSILLLPFFWLGLYWTPWRRNIRRDSALALCATAAPFAGYYLLRVLEKIWREAGVQDWSKVLSAARVMEFGHYLYAQWMPGGILALLIVAALFGLMIVQSKHKARDLCLLASIVFVVTFYFVDTISQAYTGYNRFHLPIYFVLSAGLFWAAKTKPQRQVLGIAAVLAILQLTTLVGFLQLKFGPASAESYSEYHNAPIYFPIRELILGAEKDGKLQSPGNILVVSPIPNLYPQSLAAGYRDLVSRYRFGVSAMNPANCVCASDRKGVLGLLTTQAGLKASSEDEAKAQATAQACVEQIRQSCQTKREFRQNDGQLAGILGLATP